MLRRGIILTRGEALEILAGTDTVLFDKTGTLTSGHPIVVKVHVNNERASVTEASAFLLAASLESASAHPLAQAFHSNDPLLPLERAETIAGQGVRGWIENREYRIGRQEFAWPEGNISPDSEQGQVFLADENGLIAGFEVRDALRVGAGDTVRRFREAGIDTVILSGDTAVNVEPVASELNIRNWHAGLDPAGKLAVLASLKNEGRRTLMVGDGINDAPVLAAADVSIAVQGGTELANSAADLILTGRSLELVWQARELALSTRRTIAQNLFWALLYNATMIPLAASGLLQPWMAAIGMSASSLLVVLNAARLGRQTPVSPGGLQLLEGSN